VKRIFKYGLPVCDEITLYMPFGAEILHVDAQGSDDYALCLWALVDPDSETELRTFAVRGTGHPADGLRAKDHIGTVLAGSFVWHVFERHGS
jgi:hypothetical protein